MNIFKKVACVLVAAVMLITLLPAAALAKAAADSAREAKAMQRWDDVWGVLDAVESEMMASGATRAEVTYAVYKAALNCPLIDKGSITDFTENEFSFTTDGMVGGYNYRVRNFDKAPAAFVPHTECSSHVARVNGTKNNCPSGGAVDVLLVGPYYGVDDSFTDFYSQLAASVAQATGGSVITLAGEDATGPNIAANYPGKAVVMYDSHGNYISAKGTTYLDLSSSDGLTALDFNFGWAYNGGSFFGIDGRYIQGHVTDAISNTFVWMGIDEGMKLEGDGVTAQALLEAGCAGVYGYSQAVTFTGDHKFASAFWAVMGQGGTVAEAAAAMKAEFGLWDPFYELSVGAAWPVVVSPSDPFPSDPDSEQNVACDWALFNNDPVALTGISVSPSSIVLYSGQTAEIFLSKVPGDANDYSVVWESSEPTVVSVSGGNNGAVVTALRRGMITVTVTATDNITGAVFTEEIAATVKNGSPDLFCPTDEIVIGEDYLIGFRNGNDVYLLMNNNPNPVSSSNYYYNTSNTYYGYAIKAVLDSSGNVIGVDNSVYPDAALQNVEWSFETSGSYYRIASLNNFGYYLRVYINNNSSYNDLYPASGTNGGTNWQWDPETSHLSYRVSASITRYVSFAPTAGNYSNFCYAPTTASENSEVTLFKRGSSEEEYTVTFEDWDGTVLKTENVAPGEGATAPETPERPGYDFVGWSRDFSSVYFDITVTALYEAAAVEPLPGDANADGILSSADLSVLFAYVMNAGSLTEQGLLNADINGDGVINTVDVTLLSQLIFGA